jgi:UDP-glucose 4-epimerase
MKTKVAVITGGAGFIGSHVAKHCLDLGMKVVVVDNLSGGFRDNVPEGAVFEEGDVCDSEFVKLIFYKYLPHYVFHLSAYAAEILSPHIRKFNYENNVIASMNIINECVNTDVECLVFTSSIAVMAGNEAPYQETDPYRPLDDYGIAKMSVEYSLHQALEKFGLNHIIFRPFNVYGENQNIGDKYRNVIGIFMNQIMQNQPLTVFGDGTQKRAFSYIDDVAPHIAKSVLRPELYNNTFFIGGEQPYSINELVRVIGNEFGIEPTVKYLQERHEAKVAYAITTQAQSAFGRAWTPLNLGVRKMAEWARAVGARKSKEFENIEIKKNLPEGW